MARRALRKIDPELDLADFYWEFDELAAQLDLDPLDVDRLFAQPGPLEVEVGSGKGLFLQNAAAARPQRNFLGIELARKYARFAAASLAKRRLTNAIVICADAVRLFREALADDCLAAVHVYFPDPWWKKRHHKRRVMTAQFVGHVERVLRPGGCLHFWTDVAEYFQTSVSLISQTTNLAGPSAVSQREPQHDLDYRTHFERRKRLAGLPIYRAEFRKP